MVGLKSLSPGTPSTVANLSLAASCNMLGPCWRGPQHSFTMLFQPSSIGSQRKNSRCQVRSCLRTSSAQPTSPNHWSDFVKTKRSRLCRSPRSSMAWLFCSPLSILSFKGSLLASARQITMEFGFFSSSVTISTIALFTPASSGLLPSLARTPGKSMMRLGVSHFSVSMVIKIFSFSGVLVFFLAHQLNSWHKADSPPISGKRHSYSTSKLNNCFVAVNFNVNVLLW